MVAGIIYQIYLDRQIIGYKCLQLLKVHHYAAVALKADDFLKLIGIAGTYCRRKPVTHTCYRIVIKKAAAFFDIPGLMPCHTACSVTRNGNGIFGKSTADTVKRIIRICIPLLALFVSLMCRGVIPLPCAAYLTPVTAFLCFKERLFFLIQQCFHLIKKIRGIRMYGLFHMDSGLFKLGRIYIHHYNLCLARPGIKIIPRNTDRQTVAHCQYHIGILYRKVSGTVSHITGAAAIKRMICFDKVDGIPIGTYGYSQLIHYTPKAFICAGKAYTPAGIENRPLCSLYHIQYILHSLFSQGFWRILNISILCRVIFLKTFRLYLHPLEINGNIQPYGAGTSGTHKMPCSLKVI